VKLGQLENRINLRSININEIYENLKLSQVYRKFKITKICGYNKFSEGTSTKIYYEISNMWGTKSRTTPHKTSRLLMGLKQAMKPKTLQAI